MVTLWTYDCLTDQQETILKTICNENLTYIEGAECGGYTFPERYKQQVEAQLDTWSYEYHY